MLGVTDFLDQGPARRRRCSSARSATRSATTPRSASCARARSATRSPCGAPTTASGTGTWPPTQVYFVPRWKAMLGYSEDDDRRLARGVVRAASTPRTSTALRARDRRPPAGDSPHFESEHRIRHADGSYRWVLSRGRRGPRPRRRGHAHRRLDVGHHRPQGGRGAAASTTPCHDASPGCPTGRCSSTASSSRLSRGRARSGLPLRRPLPRPRPLQARQRQPQPRGRRPAAGRARPAPASSILRPGDTVARLGGDEFTILLDDIGVADAGARRSPSGSSAILARAVRRRRPRADRHRRASASRISEPGSRSRRADARRRHRDVRRQGAAATARCAMFDRQHAQPRRRPAAARGRAARGDRARDGCGSSTSRSSSSRTAGSRGFEALARWPRTRERRSRPPSSSPSPRTPGLIGPLGRLVLHEACARLSGWRDRGAGRATT